MSKHTPRHESLPIENIKLDKTNPRIQRALDSYGDDINAERIALALKEGSSDSDSDNTTFSKLRNSIIKNDGIITPIVINEQDGEYICVEGNTRLQIYLDLYKKDKADHWKNIPCLIYTDANREEMDAIRLQAHLIGPRPWEPYAKARYLAYLWDEEYLSNDQIIQYCGGNKRQIQDSIAAYRMVENVYKPCLEHPEDFDQTRFSGFTEYQNPRVHDAVYEADFSDEEFSMWLHDQKIKRLEHVRDLPDILKHDEAKRTFLAENSTEALKILNQPSLERLMEKHDIQDILEAVSQKIRRFGYDDIQSYKQRSSSLAPVIDEALEQIGDFKKDINQG